MPAVVRVKRRIGEEPLGTFVLNGKKRRLDDGTELAAEACSAEGAAALAAGGTTTGKDEISTILKFAGTIQSQDDSAVTHLARLTKDEAKQLVQQKSRKPTDLTERARQEMRQSLHESRFRVVQCLRTTLDADSGIDAAGGAAGDATGTGAAQPKEITIVDIEKHAAVTTNAATDNGSNIATTSSSSNINNNSSNTSLDVAQPSDSDTGYVYDLYLPENEQQAEYVDLMDDNYLSVRAFDDLVYEDRFNNDIDDEYDSEDSNQENHADNDYPDEDDDYEMHGDHVNDDDDEDQDNETVAARQMRRVVEKFVFDDDDDEKLKSVDDSEEDEYNDLSSEDEDCAVYSDPYVHSVDADEECFADDVDFCDVDRYGLAYARYKARILKRLKGEADGKDKNSDDEDAGEDSAEERYHSASENDDTFYD